MKFADNASIDDNTHGGGEIPPCAGLTSNALPEVQEPVLAENSQTGCPPEMPCREPTTNRVERQSLLWLSRGAKKEEQTAQLTAQLPLKPLRGSRRKFPHWYALRVTYGREKKAYDYLVGKNVEAYYPTIKTVKDVDGKRKTVEESRLPNIFFAHGTEEEIKSFVYDNVNLPHLRFLLSSYSRRSKTYQRTSHRTRLPNEGLKIICASEAEDVIIVPPEIQKFQAGQTVRVIDGVFTGVIGKVARYHGQQRVAIIIDGLLTIASAYVPSAFLEQIK